MTPAELSRTVRRAVCRAVTDGELGVRVPGRIPIDRPRPGGTGDWATNTALALSGQAGRPPGEVAEILRARLDGTPGILDIAVTGPGFLNFTLAPARAADVAASVLRAGRTYGHGTSLGGTDATLTAGPGERAVVWTETVARLLRAQGATARTARAGAAPPGAERLTPAPERTAAVRLGRDESRWAYLSVPATTSPRPGPALLVQREDNPLFLVRYAHARACALLRNAGDLGLTRADAEAAGPPETPEGPAGTAVAGPVRVLVDVLLDHPAVLEAAARLRAPDRLARHLAVLADAVLVLQQYAHPLPRGDEKPLAAHRTRLALAEAAGTVLAGGLTLLGIDAPAHL